MYFIYALLIRIFKIQFCGSCVLAWPLYQFPWIFIIRFKLYDRWKTHIHTSTVSLLYSESTGKVFWWTVTSDWGQTCFLRNQDEVCIFVTVWMKTEGVLVLGTSVVHRGRREAGIIWSLIMRSGRKRLSTARLLRCGVAVQNFVVQEE